MCEARRIQLIEMEILGIKFLSNDKKVHGV